MLLPGYRPAVSDDIRSPPSWRWNPWEPARATSSRHCTEMKRASRKTKRWGWQQHRDRRRSVHGARDRDAV